MKDNTVCLLFAFVMTLLRLSFVFIKDFLSIAEKIGIRQIQTKRRYAGFQKIAFNKTGLCLVHVNQNLRMNP